MAKPPSIASTTSIVATRTSRRSCRPWGRGFAASAKRRGVLHVHAHVRMCCHAHSQQKKPRTSGLFCFLLLWSPQCGQAQVHLVLSVLAAEDARRRRHAVDNP